MSHAQRIFDEYRRDFPGNPERALEVACSEIAYLGLMASKGYARAKPEKLARPPKPPPQAIEIVPDGDEE